MQTIRFELMKETSFFCYFVLNLTFYMEKRLNLCNLQIFHSSMNTIIQKNVFVDSFHEIEINCYFVLDEFIKIQVKYFINIFC